MPTAASPATWRRTNGARSCERLGAALHEGRFEDGLTQALEEVTALLVEHFPAEAGVANANELPDAPVLG